MQLSWIKQTITMRLLLDNNYHAHLLFRLGLLRVIGAVVSSIVFGVKNEGIVFVETVSKGQNFLILTS